MLNFQEKQIKHLIYTNDGSIENYIYDEVFNVVEIEKDPPTNLDHIDSMVFLALNTEKEIEGISIENVDYVIQYGIRKNEGLYPDIYFQNMKGFQGLFRVLNAHFNEEVVHPIGTEFEEHLMYILKNTDIEHKHWQCMTEEQYKESISRFIEEIQISSNSRGCLALRYGTKEGEDLFGLSQIGEYVNELLENKGENKIDFVFFPYSYEEDIKHQGIVEVDLFITKPRD